MKRLLPIVVALLVGCTTPPPAPVVLQRDTNSMMAVLSVREPVSEAQVRHLVDDENSTHDVVRVFTYTDGKTPGTDKPEHLWEWTQLEGLKTRY